MRDNKLYFIPSPVVLRSCKTLVLLDSLSPVIAVLRATPPSSAPHLSNFLLDVILPKFSGTTLQATDLLSLVVRFFHHSAF